MKGFSQTLKSAFDFRVIFGFFIAPMIPSLIVGLSSIPSNDFWFFNLSLAVTGYLGYPTALLGGIPLHIFLVKMRATAYKFYLGFGFILGLLGYLGFFIFPLVTEALDRGRFSYKSFNSTWESLVNSFEFGLAGAFFAAFASFFFWLIAIFKNKKFIDTIRR